MSRPRKALIRLNYIALIPLKNGYEAIIDISDAVKVERYGWVLDGTKPNKYVHTCAGKSRKTLKLHRFILGAKIGDIVDHIDGNGLNNTRKNLRLVTASQNGANRRKIKIKTSKYKGVHKRENGKWRAAIRVNKKLINLGTFEYEIDAARAYNKAAISIFGDFACLNRFV